MAILKTFDLKGNKQSFASWISNLSPCETPFISMIPKESVDQVQYSWQTDRLSAAGKQYGGTGQVDKALPDAKEGDVVDAQSADNWISRPTVVHTNFTKIFRKGVRVSDTTKQIGLWGRSSELGYQMEKAGMELKRDVEHYILNTMEVGSLGTVDKASECTGVQKLVAALNAADGDTGAVVHKIHKYAADDLPFTKEAVFDLTYNLYLAGSRANKIMVHPQHVYLFSDFIADANKTGAKPKAPHLHRMFDGLDSKYNVFVKKIRDPLGQEFEIIPNRFMPTHQLFFFNEKDWTQMVLRAPEKSELGRTGSTQKFMIEMEVGLRHKNPFASGILDFAIDSKGVVRGITAKPSSVATDGATDAVSVVSVSLIKDDGSQGTVSNDVTLSTVTVNDNGTVEEATVADQNIADGVVTANIKHKKGARVKVKASVVDANHKTDSTAETLVDVFVPRA